MLRLDRISAALEAHRTVERSARAVTLAKKIYDGACLREDEAWSALTDDELREYERLVAKEKDLTVKAHTPRKRKT